MSNLRYIELTSTYRNRNQWPEPGEFQVPISQSGRKNAINAIDPVCLSAPFVWWKLNHFNVGKSSNLINLTVESSLVGVGGSTGTTILYVVGNSSSPENTLHTRTDYYSKCMLRDTSTAYKLRIGSYNYIGANKAKITLEGSFNPALAPGTVVQILDSTDFSNLSFPYLYIPGPSLGENVFVNKYVYNESRDEYRPVGIYDRDTNILPINTTTSVLSTRSAGPITTWLITDNVSLRVDPPVPLLSISSPFPARLQLNQPVGTTLTSSIFNLPTGTQHTNLAGSFLEKLAYYSPAVRTFPGAGTKTDDTTFVLDALDVALGVIDGFWVGSIIRIIDSAYAPLPGEPDIIGQEREIVGYSVSTGEITVSPAFSGTLTLGSATYTLYTPSTSRRIEKYVNYSGSALSPNTTTTLQFPLRGNSDEDNFYKDLFITITSGPASGDIRLITKYEVVKSPMGGIISKTVTVDSPFTGVPVLGDTFSITSGKVSPFPFNLTTTNQYFVILPFSHDNLNPLVYTGSLVSQQELVCYEVQLINLVLPNVVLGTASGSLISFYPYLYVALQNVTASGAGLNNIIYSNNPNSTKVLFRCPIKDVPNPVNSTFIKIDGSGMVQTIKFRPNDTLFFGVYLPNGDLFTTILSETMSPELPNPVIQISACFSIKRVS